MRNGVEVSEGQNSRPEQTTVADMVRKPWDQELRRKACAVDGE